MVYKVDGIGIEEPFAGWEIASSKVVYIAYTAEQVDRAIRRLDASGIDSQALREFKRIRQYMNNAKFIESVKGTGRSVAVIFLTNAYIAVHGMI